MSLDSLSGAPSVQNLAYAPAIPGSGDNEKAERLPDVESLEVAKKSNLSSQRGTMVDMTA